MSIFSWLMGKKPERRATAGEGSHHSEAIRVKDSRPPDSQSGHRKTERLERRELVYEVVRDAMLRAGVLAASYKFKVLSLDARGVQYVIMMDLSDRLAGDTVRLAEIEALIAQSAKIRHDILVTAVYWRINQPVTSGLSSQPVSPVTPAGNPPASSRPAQPAVATATVGSRYEPLQKDEIAAFKKALASSTPPAPAAGQVVKSRRRNPAPVQDFEDTQMVEPNERTSPLSATQYGDLN